MEVHHHPHAGHKKKWTHYLWEFLMLFLAVFCGFLAENQREHIVEHKREKLYMRSMLEDLISDTSEIRQKIEFIDILTAIQKRASDLLFSEDLSDDAIRAMYSFVPTTSSFVVISFETRTESQLKNAGNLRLIRNKEITDSLAIYWKGCRFLNEVLLPSYENSRLIVKDLCLSLFNYSYRKDFNPFGDSLINKRGLKLLSKDRAMLIKLGNYIDNLYKQGGGAIRGYLMNARQTAISLMKLIKEKYHL